MDYFRTSKTPNGIKKPQSRVAPRKTGTAVGKKTDSKATGSNTAKKDEKKTFKRDEKSDTDRTDVEVEERKFESAGNDRDLVDLLGKIIKS